MATRSAPTERQRRLGAELRKMRVAAGATTEYAAGLLGLDRTKISNMESGVRAITPDRIRTLACNYACGEPDYVESLAAMASPQKGGWWERYRGSLPQGLLNIAELEWHATRIQTIQSTHIPGLLHTDDYARSVFSSVLPALSRLEVELRVEHRMERRRVLDRDDPPGYLGYVHEAALHMRFGGPSAMHRQLVHLVDMTDRPHTTVRVLPVERGAFPGAGHALLYAHAAHPQLDTVQLDSAHGPEFTHAPAQLDKYRAHLRWMDENALPPAESRDFIRRVAEQL